MSPEIFLNPIPQEEFDHTIYDHPVYSFYMTVNNINGKKYFGVHKEGSKRMYYGSGKRLRYALDKYGKENFTRYIVAIFLTQKESYQFEKEYITPEMIESRDCYNIKGGGYGNGSGKLHSNYGKRGELCKLTGRKHTKQSREKMIMNSGNAKTCIVDGIEFKSKTEAARHFNVHRTTISIWLDNPNARRLRDGTKKNGKSVKCIVDGIEFKSYRQAGRYFNVSPSTIKYWLDHPNASRNNRQPVFINGIEFKSKTEAAKYFNVSHVTIIKWETKPDIIREIKANKNISGKQRKAKTCIVDGIEFTSRREAAEYFNITQRGISHRITSNRHPLSYYTSSEPAKYPPVLLL